VNSNGSSQLVHRTETCAPRMIAPAGAGMSEGASGWRDRHCTPLLLSLLRDAREEGRATGPTPTTLALREMVGTSETSRVRDDVTVLGTRIHWKFSRHPTPNS